MKIKDGDEGSIKYYKRNSVEIGGDATKLQTALKRINTEIRNTQSQMHDVNKLLKLDLGNTELLVRTHGHFSKSDKRLISDIVVQLLTNGV